MTDDTNTRMAAALAAQRAAFPRDGPPDLATRCDRLDRTIGLLVGRR